MQRQVAAPSNRTLVTWGIETLAFQLPLSAGQQLSARLLGGMRKFLLVSLVLVALPAQTEPQQLIALLRSHLDLVRAADKTTESVPFPEPDPQPLVGLPQREVRDGLGDPTFCSISGRRAAGPAECVGASVWTYSFYKLVPVHPGGGPELVLHLSPEGIVRSAQWWHSQ